MTGRQGPDSGMPAKAVLEALPGVARVLLDKAGSVLVVQSSLSTAALLRALKAERLSASAVRRSVGRRNLVVIDQAALAIVVLLAQIVLAWHGFGLEWPMLTLLLGAATMFVTVALGAPLLREAAAGLRRVRFTVELALVIGAGAGWTAGLLSALRTREASEPYFLLATVIVLSGLLAHATSRASQAVLSDRVQRLLQLVPEDAMAEGRDGPRPVRAGSLRRGRVVVVEPGATFPTDGTVLEGAGLVDESTITGTDMPQPYGPGDGVLAGTLNLGPTRRVRVTARAQDAVVGLLARLAAAEEASAVVTNGWLDRRLQWAYFGALALAAVLVVAEWFAEPDWAGSLEQGFLVITVATPAALTLVGPLAHSVVAVALRRWGIWVRCPAAIDRASQVTLLVTRMTGIITEGSRRVMKATAVGGGDERRVLSLAAAAVDGSDFRWADPVVRAAIRNGVAEAGLDTREHQSAEGVVATVQDRGRTHRIMIGSAGFLASQAVAINPNVLQGDLPGGLTAEPLFVVADGRIAGVLWLTDPIRMSSQRALLDMRANGIETCLMDDLAPSAMEQIAGAVASDSYLVAEDEPQQVAEIAAMRESGQVVAMAGHPVRDAAALRAADLSIGFGALNSPAAARTSFLVRDASPLLLSACFAAARVSKLRVRQSAFLAALPMLAAVLLAALGRLDVWVALAFFALSVGLVVANSLRMLFWRPRFSSGLG